MIQNSILSLIKIRGLVNKLLSTFDNSSFIILDYLDRVNGCNYTELANALGVTTSAITQTIQALDKLGFVDIGASDTLDNRNKFVEINHFGRGYLKEKEKEFSSYEQYLSEATLDKFKKQLIVSSSAINRVKELKGSK